MVLDFVSLLCLLCVFWDADVFDFCVVLWRMLIIDQYCKQIDNYSSAAMMKMFAIKGMPVVNQ